jgi:hypothetical protein
MLRCVDIDASTTSRHQRIEASLRGSVGANLFALIDLVAATIGLLVLAPFLPFIARSTL